MSNVHAYWYIVSEDGDAHNGLLLEHNKIELLESILHVVHTEAFNLLQKRELQLFSIQEKYREKCGFRRKKVLVIKNGGIGELA